MCTIIIVYSKNFTKLWQLSICLLSFGFKHICDCRSCQTVSLFSIKCLFGARARILWCDDQYCKVTNYYCYQFRIGFGNSRLRSFHSQSWRSIRIAYSRKSFPKLWGSCCWSLRFRCEWTNQFRLSKTDANLRAWLSKQPAKFSAIC